MILQTSMCDCREAEDELTKGRLKFGENTLFNAISSICPKLRADAAN